MAFLAKAESKRLHSWLWDSHISPKNSKWLHENLTDMDLKVKAMFKLINEDADSFARKAEMYYKRRPELTKLIEEFYRAYRALAERYVHATRALKQAHRTMAEAFPNQIPPVADDSPSGSVNGEEPPTPMGTPPSIDSPFDSVASQKDGAKKNGSSDMEFMSVRKGLKPPGPVSSKFLGVGPGKELNFDEEFEDAFEKAKKLQEKISNLTSENENLLEKVKAETQNASKVQNEVEILKAAQSKLIFEKEEALKKFQECLKKVTYLEEELNKFKRINDELLMKAKRSDSADEMYLLLKKENEALKFKLTELEQKSVEQQEELTQNEEELERLKNCVKDERLRSEQTEEALGSLEKLHAETQEKLKTSYLEIENGTKMLKDMELKKQALEEDIRRVQEDNDNLNNEVKLKQEELEKLNASLQNELARSMQAESALQSLEKLHTQSQEELQQLMLDIQSKVDTLEDVEGRKRGLEEELIELKEEIRILNEQNVSSKTMIQQLQDEILDLKKANHKLETEVRHHAEGKEDLQKDLCGLKDELNILQQKHREMTDQMQAVGLDEQSFHTSVKDLQAGNLELRETCTRQVDENMLLLEKLELMEKISEKNTKLEISLQDANLEIDELRAKVNALQISYEALNQQHLVLVSEKNFLVIKVGSITQDMGKLLENNTFLENSVSDANYELEELRGKMKILEEAAQVLHNDNSNLQSEKSILLSQVELIGRSLESLEKKYVELHDLHSSSEREKESTQKMLTELSEMSKVEKREHEDFRHSTDARLAILESQINLLHEDNSKREEKYRDEQFKLLAAQIETFILEQCLCDLRHGNMSLAREHHKLEKHIIGQEGKMLLLLELIGRLRKGMHKVLNALFSNEHFEFSDAMEESCWQFILNKVKEIQHSIIETEDENIRLQIENVINETLIQQLGFEIAELKSDKDSLKIDCQKRTEELFLLQAERSNILGINDQLMQDLKAGSEREDTLEKEIKTLGEQLSELKEVYSISQDENSNLLQESQLLSSELKNLRAEKTLLEEEIRSLLQEFVHVDCLSLIYEQFNNERTTELKRLIHELQCSHESNKDLQKKVQEMDAKIHVIEEENFKLKEYVLKSEECKSHLTVSSVEGSIVKDVNRDLNYHISLLSEEIESGESLLILKQKELSEAHGMILDLQGRDKEMHHHLVSTLAEVEEAKSERDGLQKQVFSLSSEVATRDKDVAHVSELNETLHREILKLSREKESLKAKEEQWATNLLSEVEKCENEVAVLCNDIQEATVHVAVFEDKIQELMGVCEKLEIKSMVERTTLSEEVSLRNLHIEKLSGQLSGVEGSNSELKSELDEYLPLISSLGHGISALESYLIPSEKHYSRDQMQVEPNTIRPDHIESIEDNSKELMTVPEGVLELKRLLGKVEAIQGILVQSRGRPTPHGNLGVESNEERKEGEVIMESSDSHSIISTPPVILESEHENNLVTEAKVSNLDEELAMKDIQLDQTSSSSKFDGDDSLYMMDVNGNFKTNDHTPPFSSLRSTGNFQTEETEEEKGEYPSSGLLIERELSVDKVEVPKKDSQHDWKQEVIEKLKLDSHRLVVLEESMEELKKRIEKSEKSNGPKSSDYESVKSKLQEADKDILLLANINRKLTNRAEDFPSLSERENMESDDLANLQKKITGRAQRGSEKIGRLELELQKIQYILLKLEEEQENQNNKSSARRKVLLRDYLYGRGGDGRRKKSFFSWCTRPQTKDT